MKTVAEIAQEAIARMEREEAAAKSASEWEQDKLRKQHDLMENEIYLALGELKKLGCVVEGKTVQLRCGKVELFADYVHGTFRHSDESPEEEYQNYVIRWRDSRGEVHGGHSTPESFREGFGNWVARYL